MGVFQASMLEAMKSLRDEMQSMKKASKAEVDKTSTALSKAGPSKQPDPITRASDPTTRASDHSDAQPMDTDVYGPPLPPKFSPTMLPSTRIFSPTNWIINRSTTRSNLKGCIPNLRSTWTRKNTRFGQSTILSRLLQRKISPLSLSKSLLNRNWLLLSLNINRIAQTQFSTGR